MPNISDDEACRDGGQHSGEMKMFGDQERSVSGDRSESDLNQMMVDCPGQKQGYPSDH